MEERISFEKMQKDIEEIQELIKIRMEFCKSISENIAKFQKRIERLKNKANNDK